MSPNDPGGSRPPKTSEQLFLEHLPLVERAARHACRRYHFSPEEAEDFLSEVKLKLIEDDYAVIRKFSGSSTFATYLAVVIHNFAKDYVNHLWGKWRSCAEAKRCGPDAVLLDRLLSRDGMTLDEATKTMTHNHKVDLTADQIADIAARLPARVPRQQVGEEALASVPARDSSSEDLLISSERARLRQRTHDALRLEFANLPAEARLILRRWIEGAKVSLIARSLNWDQQALYRERDKHLRRLKAGLLARGIREEEIREVLRLDDWEQK